MVADQEEAVKAVLKLGPFMKGPDGMPRPNPALVRLERLSIVKARLLAAIQVLGQAGAEEHDPARPQKRSGVRGVYGKLRAVE